MNYETSNLGNQRIADAVESFVLSQDMKRKIFERRWYDNKFFDDGFHFRFLSRTTGKIVDLSNNRDILGPTRSIPKASRQIRGLANLLMGIDPFPVIYPPNINKNLFPTQINPQTGKEESPQYKEAVELAKKHAQNVGFWVTREWEDQNLEDKTILALILAAIGSVSYIQVYNDPKKQKIHTQNYDSFDIYADGWLNDLEESPMVVKACPKLISQIKATSYFDKKQLAKINPDNRYASSEIKQAYMQARYGRSAPSDHAATLILKEAYIKEHVSEENRDRINEDLGDKATRFKSGDVIIRHVFEAGGIWLRDKYTALKYYPFVPFTYEPGPLYQVPLIERFIPANKSLDTVMSRVERYLNTMVAGSWIKRKGENFEITNKAGGNVYEYEATPPVQAQIAPIPNTVWNYIQQLNEIIEEQGASTAALGQLPPGVKSGIAIETLKATEYANLKIATKQLKLFTKRITERMIDIAANNFVNPFTVERMDENDDPDYFDIMGEQGVKARRAIGEEVPLETTIIRDNTRVEIEVESGLGFTEQGKRETMMKIIDYMVQLAQAGMVNPESIKVAVKEMLNTFAFGSTQEFMQALEEGAVETGINEEELLKMKTAVLEALNEAGEVGPKASEKRVMETKVGVVEALKESGLADEIRKPVPDNPETAPINYKDAPPSIKRQMEMQAGFQPATDESPSEIEAQAKVVDAETKAIDTEVKVINATKPEEPLEPRV